VLDVTDPERLPPDHPVLHLPTCSSLPPGRSQGYELRRFGELAVAEVAHLVGGEPLHGVVHASELSRVA
jgi:phosphoglycerate dehydrogenase-like enzyme